MSARDALAGIRARLEAASIHDGPWSVEEDDTWGAKVYVREPGFGTMYICENLNQQEDGLADAEFIAHAPADMARLIKAVEAVEAIAERLAKSRHCEDVEIAENIRAALTAALGGGELAMLILLRRLFARKPQRHYPAMWDGHQGVCNCGYHSAWDYNLRKHFEETGRIGQ